MTLLEGAHEFGSETVVTSAALSGTELSPAYSLSFWLYVERWTKTKAVSILVHGKSPEEQQPGLYIQSERLLLRFSVEHSGIETLFSSCPLETKLWTNVSLTIETQGNYTESTLYINGNFNSQITTRGSLAQPTAASLILGKCPWLQGFQGMLAEPCLVTSAAVPAEIWARIYQYSKEKYQESGRFDTIAAYEWATAPVPVAGPEPPLIEGHSTNTSLMMSQSEASPTRKARLEAFLSANEPLRVLAEALVENYDWLMTIFLILRATLPTITDPKLEIDRMIPPIQQAKVAVNREDLLALAKVTKTHETIEYGDKLPAWSDRETDELIAFGELLGKLREAITGEPGDREPLAAYDKSVESFLDTRSADLEIGLDHCVSCASHQTTFWHTESQFSALFNSTSKRITEDFPNFTVIGNKYGPAPLGVFQVLVEGVGAAKKWDAKGRLVLFRKSGVGNWTREVLDVMYLLGYCYGGFGKLAEEQGEYRRNSPARATHPDAHVDLLQISESTGGKSKKKREREYDPDTVMYCLNWACVSKQYIYGKNDRRACRHHPGRWEFGSVHGLWPENWTCCRRNWEEEGCAIGPHRGIPYNQFPRLCINHGEINPLYDAPDSFCGKSFTDPVSCGKKYVPEKGTCKLHAGLRRGTVWACCGAEAVEGLDVSFCEEQDHRYAEWPEEEAKIYFVTKEVGNPGLAPGRSSSFTLFSKLATTSRYFCSKIKPYIDPVQRKKTSEALLQEPRYCLNSACESTFKEAENTPKSCKCHTGYYDFGHSGSQTSSNKETKRIVLWEAHWRCCGGAWESPGCTKTPHRGPLVSMMPARKWKWPSEAAKRYFIKKISNTWQQKLDKEHISKQKISRKYDQICAEARAQKLPGNYLFRLCMALHLHILCVSPDMSYMFKYQDVVSGKAEAELVGQDGFIDKEAFDRWWFAPLEAVRPQMAG